MRSVTLGDGLEMIGFETFKTCTSLNEIIIPNTVRTIKRRAFALCRGLTTVTFGMGLEEIEAETFSKCFSLEFILIPDSIEEIHQLAFHASSNLRNVMFCQEIEQFVTCSGMRDWWGQGVHRRSLTTYTFLLKNSIQNRLELVRVRSWQANIHEMLIHIQYIDGYFVNTFFRSIESKLSFYESLKDCPALLELAIWKLKIAEQYDQSNIRLLTNNMKRKRSFDSVTRLQCRTDSLTVVMIIVPLVFSFLTDGCGRNGIVGDSDDDDNEDGYDYNDQYIHES